MNFPKETPHVPHDQALINFDTQNIHLDLDRILFEEEPIGNFAFTTETQVEGRKIGYAIGKALHKLQAAAEYQEGSEASLLQSLTKPGLIEDCRIDGNQLSFCEEYNAEYHVWEISIFVRNDSPDSALNTNLRKVIRELGFPLKNDPK